MGVDEVGVDEMGSRRSGTTPLYTGIGLLDKATRIFEYYSNIHTNIRISILVFVAILT